MTRVVDQGHHYGLNATSGDDVVTFYTYSPNTTDWIVGLPYRIGTQEGSHASPNATPYINLMRMYYDSNSLTTAPQQGRVTTQLVEVETGTWGSTTYTHETNGQVNTATQALPGADATTDYDYNSSGNVTSTSPPFISYCSFSTTYG